MTDDTPYILPLRFYVHTEDVCYGNSMVEAFKGAIKDSITVEFDNHYQLCGKFQINWICVEGGECKPKLEIFSDSWWMMDEYYEFSDVFRRLSVTPDKCITPSDIKKILDHFGFENRSSA